MPDSFSPPSPRSPQASGELFPREELALRIAFDVPAGGVRFEWRRAGVESAHMVTTGWLRPSRRRDLSWRVLSWEPEDQDHREMDHCLPSAPSVTALLKRIAKRLPLADTPEIGFVLDTAAGLLEAGRYYALKGRPGVTWQKSLGR